jgi:hypothetical protein
VKNIKIVLQCEGAAQVLVGDVNSLLSVGEALAALGAKDVEQADQWIFAEERDDPVDPRTLVQALVSGKGDGPALVRLHQSRCRRVTVNVTFNGVTKSRDFPPVTRVGHVHRWATHNAFGMSPRDAAEHVLELEGGDERPDQDTQIGTLTSGTLCAVAFDLVPFKRVEG